MPFFSLLSRCLRSKCPVCGQGRLFAKPSGIRSLSEILLPLETCESCGFRFAREPGYYFGVITPILPILSLGTAIVAAATAYFGFHQDLDTVVIAGASGGAVGFFAFFRTAIALFIAFDHAIAPPSRE